MIITIITGGTGSTNIQKGFNEFFPKLSINLLINGYDDGKSTGILRKLFPNTLGISDYRKNQILEYKLLYGNNNIYKLLNNRFTNNEPYKYIINLINNTNFDNNNELQKFLLDNIKYFFETEQSKLINYEDFSFMNIIYCSLLDKNNNNIEIVCEIIKNNLGLKNNIFVNSNQNLILKAITQNGNILLDEASIVDFNDKNDKIIDIFFDNNDNPILNYKTQELLLNSDIILFSCGTQFSSLIPTYKTLLFKETINKSKALKFLVLNSDYDNDIINYSGNELLDKINEYISLNDILIIISDNMNDKLFPTTKKYNYINIPSLIKNKQHNGFLIWKYIFNYYFKYYYNNFYIFDYDYTLYDKDNIEVSIDNINLLENIKNKIIITNNSFLNLLPLKNIDIYSNFGNIYNNEKYIDKNFILNEQDINNLNKIIQKIDNKNYTITNRKNISISIKPIDNRNEIINIISLLLIDTNYEIVLTGKTTIEFIKKGLSKRNIFNIKNFLKDSCKTYISDTNDIEYNLNDKIKFLQVQNIYTTNLFLKSIIINEKYDFCIIVGGINKRMNINYPKCLYEVDNEIILIKIINNIIPYANNIYICGNNYYKNNFLEFEKSIKNFNNIYFLYFNSIDNLQNYPKGNAETIYQLLNNIYNLTNKIFIMWGDIIISNNKIFEEMYNNQYNNDFLIPTKYENNPYAYLIIDDKNNVKNIEYKKNINIDYGYHDQCIFLCDKNKIKQKLEIIVNQNYEELNFLDIIKYLDNVAYFETKFPLKSFNTINEL